MWKERVRFLLFLPIVLSVIRCMAFYQPDPERIKGLYYDQIKEWQEKIKKEGWEDALVDDVINHCILFSKHRADGNLDRWDTPKEFIQRGFQGDCEDIAAFIWATMKRLRYPRNIRILVVKTLLGDHTVIRIEMLHGGWKIYETIPMPFDDFDRLFFIPVVEFDEDHILYYKKQEITRQSVESSYDAL